MIEFFMQYELTKEEENMLKAYISTLTDKFDGSLDYTDFEKILIVDKKQLGKQRRFKVAEAKQTLLKIKQIMTLKRTKILTEIEGSFQSKFEKDKQTVNIRNFKSFLFHTCCLNSYEIDNVTDYLDRNSDGFITIADI